ncbi:hypothetical protein SAMD00079811_49230 [Scytonema sp. HK-05]|nr:hypothetical protein NIES2130_38215 [Scytonema sp. HK-05]BAY47305.1 hypothetical protein SAMD00079811_49230 [Scytonema sp. HK-05]
MFLSGNELSLDICIAQEQLHSVIFSLSATGKFSQLTSNLSIFVHYFCTANFFDRKSKGASP